VGFNFADSEFLAEHWNLEGVSDCCNQVQYEILGAAYSSDIVRTISP
jgi:hypothetical protein